MHVKDRPLCLQQSVNKLKLHTYVSFKGFFLDFETLLCKIGKYNVLY